MMFRWLFSVAPVATLVYYKDHVHTELQLFPGTALYFYVPCRDVRVYHRLPKAFWKPSA